MTAQREITDADGLTWTCIQAYAGLGNTAAKQDAARIQGSQDGSQDGSQRLAVVCTPSGGARSVRLTLPPDWAGMDEAALLAAIKDGSEG